ncbi:M23 family metallopeptidase [Novosphingobium fuchskuhlense]|uniref:M23 family metallopeptidase n=1 Tax=Novosphingobium fuchskuhlense TaxID=1117702 RepID=UPI0009EA80B9|nr:M23 family metallopeptidase [Novosphingobium fuchskuhlense]
MSPAGAVLRGALATLAVLGACGASQAPAVSALPVAKSQHAPQALPAPAPAPIPSAAPTSVSVGGLQYRGRLTQGGWLRGQAPDGTRAVTLGGTPLPLASDGTFFAAFDRDAPASLALAVTASDGFTLSTELAIAPRSWRIESINVAKRPGKLPDAEFQARRAAELARIGAARRLGSTAGGWRQGMIWPAAGRISGEFGSQRIYRGEPGAYHAGIDLAAPAGAEIRAPADGVVTLAAGDAPFTLEGHLLILDHGMGLTSAFLHCSDLVVREGDTVAQGQLLGHVGMTGRATGPHLHWAMTWRGRRLDPRLFANPER